jgi:L-ribulose-5-phosphate 4-epimerase
MLLKDLRIAVLEANLELVKRGLVLYTFGNASGIDRDQGLIVIKPSGVDYGELSPELMVVTDLLGRVVDGKLKPSSDLDTHTLLYREFPAIGAVVHTHSEFATSFAQAGLQIPPLGTTHADYFHGPVPVTAPLTDEAIGGRYVYETGLAIARHFKEHGIDPLAVPACLVNGHAPFCWGRDPYNAAHNAVVLEAVARMAYRTLTLNAECEGVSQALLNRHYHRKHGSNATYGQ